MTHRIGGDPERIDPPETSRFGQPSDLDPTVTCRSPFSRFLRHRRIAVKTSVTTWPHPAVE